MGCVQQQSRSGRFTPSSLQHPQQEPGEEKPLLVLHTAPLCSAQPFLPQRGAQGCSPPLRPCSVHLQWLQDTRAGSHVQETFA